MADNFTLHPDEICVYVEDQDKESDKEYYNRRTESGYNLKIGTRVCVREGANGLSFTRNFKGNDDIKITKHYPMYPEVTTTKTLVGVISVIRGFYIIVTINTNDFNFRASDVGSIVIRKLKQGVAAWHSVARQFRPGGVAIPPDIENLVSSYLSTHPTTQSVSNEHRNNLSEALRHANGSLVTDPLGATNSNGRPVLVKPYRGGKQSRHRVRRRKNRRTRSRK